MKYWFAAVLLVTISRSAFSQPLDSAALVNTYRSDPTFFIEPNRFSIDKDFGTRFLWLEAGYGKTVVNAGSVGFGAEALIWSRLLTLSDFRFPVQTADYFFGIYSTFQFGGQPWRVRISHISSHDVDGRDSVIIGGSSSHFSREWVEVSTERVILDRLHLTFGIRYLFHQVTKIESSLQVPIGLRYSILTPTKDQIFGLYPFLSSGDSPVGPSIAVGLGGVIRNKSSETELQLYYQSGASWAGTEAAARSHGLKLQLNVRDAGD